MKHLHNLANQMIVAQFNSRPTCAQILNNSDIWSLDKSILFISNDHVKNSLIQKQNCLFSKCLTEKLS